MNATEILDRLVGFPSVVGTPNDGIVAWIRDYAERCGAKVTILPGPEGDRANLFATIGPRDRSGYIISGHMDVVPALEANWTSDPFQLRKGHDCLFGRGTSDMKGFLAAALAALPMIANLQLTQPLHFAFSYDEEAGCRGVPHLIRQLPELCASPLGAIIGEPSSLRAIRAHKGKAAARIEIQGRSGHSSRPDQGLNAIHAFAHVLLAAVRTGEALQSSRLDPGFEPPYSSLQIGTVSGGQAVNIIPDLLTAEIEARAITGVAPTDVLEPVKHAVDTLAQQGFHTAWEVLSSYPALSLAADAPLARLMEELTGVETQAAVSYGTEAGLYQAAGIDAIICGPGDIARAHRADEYIRIDELAACQAMIERLAETLVS